MDGAEGGRGRGSILASFDISPYAPTPHAPRLLPQVPLCTPPFTRLTLSSGSKMGLQSFNPSSPSTHPPLLPSVRSAAGGKWGGGGGCGGQGANPLFHPDEFSNFLCLHALSQIHAPNLSTIQPLWFCPPSPPTSFLCCFGWRSKSKTGGSRWLAAIHTDSILTASRTACHHTWRHRFFHIFLMHFSLFIFVPPWGVY